VQANAIWEAVEENLIENSKNYLPFLHLNIVISISTLCRALQVLKRTLKNVLNVAE
jgi:hypothetical protein